MSCKCSFWLCNVPFLQGYSRGIGRGLHVCFVTQPIPGSVLHGLFSRISSVDEKCTPVCRQPSVPENLSELCLQTRVSFSKARPALLPTLHYSGSLLSAPFWATGSKWHEPMLFRPHTALAICTSVTAPVPLGENGWSQDGPQLLLQPLCSCNYVLSMYQ